MDGWVYSFLDLCLKSISLVKFYISSRWKRNTIFTITFISEINHCLYKDKHYQAKMTVCFCINPHYFEIAKIVEDKSLYIPQVFGQT